MDFESDRVMFKEPKNYYFWGFSAYSTNATSELTFSHKKRIKSYLRSTTGQQRFNNLMIPNIHKKKTDTLNLLGVARDFVLLYLVRSKLFVFIY